MIKDDAKRPETCCREREVEKVKGRRGERAEEERRRRIREEEEEEVRWMRADGRRGNTEC